MASRQVTLELTGIPDSRRALVALDLRGHLVRIGVAAETVEEVSAGGTRGDVTLLGQLALGLISSGSVVALIECLKAYIVRERKLVIEIRRPDGTHVKVSADNIDDPTLVSTIASDAARA